MSEFGSIRVIILVYTGRTDLNMYVLVVPKSYRPKGQPRSTRNEFPIRADFGNSRKHPIWRLKRGEN